MTISVVAGSKKDIKMFFVVNTWHILQPIVVRSKTTLTLSQTTNFRLFQTERDYRRQSET